MLYLADFLQVIFIHCLMHTGNLVTPEGMQSIPVIRDASGFANDLALFSWHSTKLSTVVC